MTDSSAAPVLEVRSVCKSFPGVRALHNVNLHVQPGEVLALLGENGAGKSTLMKILAGVQSADSGEYLIDAQSVQIHSVESAQQHGVALIHQELNLADNLEVGANIFLGREPARFGFINKRQIEDEASRYLQRVGLHVPPRTIAADLSIGQQQLVEIAKALSVNARILIMDEPTSSLSQSESERLFEVVRDLRDRGVSVIYITHRLGEVQTLADRAVVLRDGENAGELSHDQLTHDAMVRLMVGRDVNRFYDRKPHPSGQTLLDVRKLRTQTYPQHALSFQLRAGEIVGVAGLIGAGRTEMLRAVFGYDHNLGGEIVIKDRPCKLKNPADAIRQGVALVPEDRKSDGLVIDMPVNENISLPGLSRHRRMGMFLNRQVEARDTARMIDELRIKTPSAHQIVRFLSGGNQQKIVLGKWLALSPSVLLLDEPTRGIDVGAKQEIYTLMDNLAATGMAVLFVSSDLEEIRGMSDRVLVMHEGRLAGELTRDQLSEEAVMHLATGGDQAA